MTVHRLTIENLACIRGSNLLFGNFNVSLQAGQCLQILGNNGSGKSTLLHTVAGIHRPGAGSVQWDGKPLKQYINEGASPIAYLGHRPGIRSELTIRENLDFHFALNAISAHSEENRLEELIVKLDLVHIMDLPCGQLSQGQRQRAVLLPVMMGNRPLWLLDEPTTSLDARGTEAVQHILCEHLAHGGLVIFTGHHRLLADSESVFLGD